MERDKKSKWAHEGIAGVTTLEKNPGEAYQHAMHQETENKMLREEKKGKWADDWGKKVENRKREGGLEVLGFVEKNHRIKLKHASIRNKVRTLLLVYGQKLVPR